MSRVISFSEAKRRYTNRYTMEYVPAWARGEGPGNGKYYAPQYSTDREWYDNTVFPGEGNLPEQEGHCMTMNASWPLGEWLEEPYRIT